MHACSRYPPLAWAGGGVMSHKSQVDTQIRAHGHKDDGWLGGPPAPLSTHARAHTHTTAHEHTGVMLMSCCGPGGDAATVGCVKRDTLLEEANSHKATETAMKQM